MKRRVVIVIGIERCGNLPKLPGAVYGARKFAEWATKQSYDTVELLTDEENRKVRFDDVRAKVKDAVDALDVGRLILFFAGHGCSSAQGDSWLLSQYNINSDEVISVMLSEFHARRCGIDQVSFISDACRDATRGQQFLSQRSLFQKLQRPTTPAQWDRFAAADIDAAAQEVPGTKVGGALTESYGIFTNCLMQALNGNVLAALQNRKGRGPSVSSASLANYLEKAVLYESSLLATAQPQYVDAIPSWRPPDDIYASFPKGHIILSTSALDRTEPTIKVFDFYRSSWDFELDQLPGSLSRGGRKSVASEAIHKLRERQTRGVRQRRAKFAKAEGRQSFETHTGITLVGSAVKRVAVQPKHELFNENNVDHIRVFGERASTVLVEITETSWITVVTVPGFIATIMIEKGLAISLSYTPSGNSNFAIWQTTYRDKILPVVRRWTALMEAGKTPHTKDITEIIEAFRQYHYSDPAIGILAAHIYERLGDLDKLQELADLFAIMTDEYGLPGWVPFDLAFLADQLPAHWTGSLRSNVTHEEFRLAGSFPLMTQGWGYLEINDERVPRAVLNVREGLLPAMWTTFDADAGAVIATEIEDGRLA